MTTTFSGTAEELAELWSAASEVSFWLDLKMRTGRYSFGLILELARHMIVRAYNVHTIYREIGILEGSDIGRSLTKPAAPFESDALKGLSHKHHHQARFIPKNLKNEMSRPGAMRAALAPYFGRYVHEVAGEIAHAMTIAAYERRASDQLMTGEWIIFEPSPMGNYYLTLSTHDGETNEQRRARVEEYRAADARVASAAAAKQPTSRSGE